MRANQEWTTWRDMHKRCYNPKNSSYKYYGAKGIAVDARWHEYKNFLVDMGRKPPGKHLDRIDRTKNYGPSNCRWSSDYGQHQDKGQFRHYVSIQAANTNRPYVVRQPGTRTVLRSFKTRLEALFFSLNHFPSKQNVF